MFSYLIYVVCSLVYFGSMLAEECSFDEISSHIEKASGSFSDLEKRVWSQHDLKFKTKFMVYKACVLTSLLYACEMWMLYKHWGLLNVSINNAYDQYFVLDGYLRSEALERAGLLTLESIYVKSCLRWVGHVIQKDDSCLPKQLFYDKICKGKRKASKSKKRFNDCVKICLRQLSILVSQWGKVALYRSHWCELINVGIESFASSCVQFATYKWFVHRDK